MLSNELDKALREAGWSPERKVPTAHWIANLLKDGFQPIPQAVDIISNFGGLTLQPVLSPNDVYRTVPVFFDPEMPGGMAEVDRISYWEKRLAVQMNPIADLSFGHSALILSAKGEVYSTFDSVLFFRGHSLYDALEHTLIFGTRCPLKVGEIED